MLLLNWKEEMWKCWCDMPRMYMKVVPRTKFVLLKVPLSTCYEEKFGGDRYVFTVSMYADRCVSQKLNVTCVMDATKLQQEEEQEETKNWYYHNVQEWDDYGMDHHTLQSDTKSTVEEEFVKMCANHWKEQPNTLIALYDDRGGWGYASYLIAYHMCAVFKAPVHAALASLATINKSTTGCYDLRLVQKLQSTFHGTRPISFPISQLPSWWYDDTGIKDNNKEVITISPCPKKRALESETDNDNHKNKLLKSATPNQLPKCWMPLPKTSNRYKRALTVYQQLITSGNKKKQQQPSELLLSHKEKLQHSNYKLVWYPNGIFGFLLFLHDGVFLITTNNTEMNVHQLQPTIQIPSPQNPKQYQHRTLLQATIVTSSDNISAVVVQDIIAHNGGIVVHKSWKQRCAYWMDGVINVFVSNKNNNKSPIKLHGMENFSLDQLHDRWTTKTNHPFYPIHGLLLVSTNSSFFTNDHHILPSGSLQLKSYRQELLDQINQFNTTTNNGNN